MNPELAALLRKPKYLPRQPVGTNAAIQLNPAGGRQAAKNVTYKNYSKVK